MNDFTFSYPVKVYFGKGAAAKALAEQMPGMGQRVLLATGGGSVKKNGIYDELHGLLTSAGKTVVDFAGILPNPTYAKVQEGAALARANRVDFILAVGGGSVIDCCKAVSVQARLDEDLWDYEYTAHKTPTDGIPMGAVVTASGTGAEMNGGGVITNGEKKCKGPLWGTTARFAVLDPAYTMSLPMKQVFSGAFDTLSHCMETYMGSPRTPNTSDEITEAVMRSTIRSIRVLLTDPQNYEARNELMWTSAMAENGVLKIGKITDFQAHMIEHQLGAYTDCNHGQGLAVIHPALYRRYAESEAGAAQLARMAEAVWGVATGGMTQRQAALAGVDALESFIREIGLPTTLTGLGDPDEAVLQAVADTAVCTPGCCIKLTPQDILSILHQCR